MSTAWTRSAAGWTTLDGALPVITRSPGGEVSSSPKRREQPGMRPSLWFGPVAIPFFGDAGSSSGQVRRAAQGLVVRPLCATTCGAVRSKEERADGVSAGQPRVVGLAGLEPAPSSLSEIDSQALCYPALPLVVPINEGHRDGVNDASRETSRRPHLTSSCSGCASMGEWVDLPVVVRQSRKTLPAKGVP
jgi:hypothetical protein